MAKFKHGRYYKYSSFRVWIFVMKQETFSMLNHVNGKRARWL